MICWLWFKFSTLFDHLQLILILTQSSSSSLMSINQSSIHRKISNISTRNIKTHLKEISWLSFLIDIFFIVTFSFISIDWKIWKKKLRFKNQKIRRWMYKERRFQMKIQRVSIVEKKFIKKRYCWLIMRDINSTFQKTWRYNFEKISKSIFLLSSTFVSIKRYVFTYKTFYVNFELLIIILFIINNSMLEAILN